MALSVDTLIEDIRIAANAAGAGADNLLASLTPEVTSSALGYKDVALVSVLLPTSETYSTLTALPTPQRTEVNTRINALVAQVRGMYADNFPEIAIDLDNRAAVARSIHAMINDGTKFNGTDYVDELEQERTKMAEELRISELRVKDKWAAAGYSRAPGQLLRELSEQYTVRLQQLQQARLAIMERAFMSVLPQFKAAVQQAQDMALTARTNAINATTELIRVASKDSAIPGTLYAARVSANTAMAEAVAAQFKARKEFDRVLLETYAANLDNEALLNRYYTSMYPRDVGTQVQLAVAKANSAGAQASSLWQALNVVASSSTTSF